MAKLKWRCKICGDIVTSNTKEVHKMDWCKCGKSAVDAEEHYVRLTGEAELFNSLESLKSNKKPVKHLAWYRFWKKSGPAALLSERYLWLDKETYSKKKDVEAECEYWAERTGGGHNTHYSYGFEEIPNPPQSVLEKMISDEKKTIKHHRDYLKFLQQTLDTIK